MWNISRSLLCHLGGTLSNFKGISGIGMYSKIMLMMCLGFSLKLVL